MARIIARKDTKFTERPVELLEPPMNIGFVARNFRQVPFRCTPSALAVTRSRKARGRMPGLRIHWWTGLNTYRCTIVRVSPIFAIPERDPSDFRSEKWATLRVE